jgi:hypothetical protein
MDTNCSEYLWENPALLMKSYYVHSKKYNCKNLLYYNSKEVCVIENLDN